MGCRVEIGGAEFFLDPAGISCVRYRAAYGESVVNHLAECKTARELEGRLLRLCHMMIPPKERPALLEFARLCGKDARFVEKALEARGALLTTDPRHSPGDEGDGAPFDEYKLLALVTAAGLDMALLYELPILHLVALVDECFKLKGGEQTEYRAMSKTEMARLYPR